MTSSQHGPYALGDTRATMVQTMGFAKPRGGANPQNAPQYGLESATRLHEDGIASNRGSAISR